MLISDAMYTFDGRLGSFASARPLTKGRASSAKSQKTVSWPHATPSSAQLARAGFFYTPTTSSIDNVTCFMCQKSLDGWEEDDDPVLEHLHHSERCAWALIASVLAAVDAHATNQEHPLSDKMKEARRTTFADRWPHEGKKGWVCKVEQMVTGGWYYCPTPESDDFVACPYCSLALDGWEPKDKPLEEHRRRSPNCPFVAITDKAGKSRKGARSSKASRISSQSSVAVDPESSLQDDFPLLDGNSALTIASVASMASNTGKKGTKANRTTGKSKARKAKDQTMEMVEATSIPEPENLDFKTEVEKPTKPAKPTKGRKRKSSELESDDTIDVQQQNGPNDVVVTMPAPKRRATRTRSSVAQQVNVHEPAPEPVPNRRATRTRSSTTQSTHAPEPFPELSDADQHSNSRDDFTIPVLKKKVHKTGGRKPSTYSHRTSKRKVSSVSTASKASLRNDLPNDDELERALEVDLDRPMTDEEDAGYPDLPIEVESEDIRPNRKQSAARKASTTIAPARKAVRDGRATRILADSDRSPAQAISMELERVSSSPALPLQQAKGAKGSKGSKRTKLGKRAETLSIRSEKLAEVEHEAVSLQISKATPPASPQSSDAENHPPSSRPPISSPARQTQTPRTRFPFTASTPLVSPSKRDVIHGSGIQCTIPWVAVDLETVFLKSPGLLEDDEDKENKRDDLLDDAIQGTKGTLTSPEKGMSVEEWVHYNARLGEERLRRECEGLISVFEKEGNRALQVLESIQVVD